MKMYKLHTTAIVVLMSLTWGVGRSAASQPKHVDSLDPDGKVGYSAPVVIMYDPAVLPLDPLLINFCLAVPPVSERVAAGMKADRQDASELRGFYAEFDVIDGGQEEGSGRLVGFLSVGINAGSPTAEVEPRHVWQATVEELEKALSSTAKRLQQAHEAKWELQHELLRSQRDHIEGELENAIVETLGEGPDMDVAEQLQTLSGRKQEISLELAGTEARRQAIQEQLEELRSASPTAELDDEIIGQLEKIVEFQKKQLEAVTALYASSGTVTMTEVSKAEAESAQARIELLRAKKEAAAKSSPAIAALTEELARATIQAAEQRAVLKELDKRISRLTLTFHEQRPAQQKAQEAEHRVAVLRRKLAAFEERLSAGEIEGLMARAARGSRVEVLPWRTRENED